MRSEAEPACGRAAYPRVRTLSPRPSSPATGAMTRRRTRVCDTCGPSAPERRTARHEGFPADAARRLGMRPAVSVPGVHRPFTALVRYAHSLVKARPKALLAPVGRSSTSRSHPFARVNRRPSGSFGPLGRRILVLQSVSLPLRLLVDCRPVVFRAYIPFIVRPAVCFCGSSSNV